MNLVRRYSLLIVLFAVAITTASSAYLASRLSSSSTTACQIQKRGLSAQPFLVGSLDDLHWLLTQPLTPKQRAAQLHEPKSVRQHLTALDNNLAKYVVIERAQPKTRDCG